MKKLIIIICYLFLHLQTFQLVGQVIDKTKSDTTIYSYHTSFIKSKKYYGYLNRNGFHLFNSKNRELLNISEPAYENFRFKDFNNDGFKDIYLLHTGNIPERYTLYLYNVRSKSFKEVKNFYNFPSPKRLKNTKYFFSYHRNGCADDAWISDLFYVKNYRAFRIGTISGDGCGVKDGIYIYKFDKSTRILKSKLPLTILKNYKGYKWEFIVKYWSVHYKQFI